MSLNTFIAAIAKNGGMSMTNGYDVEFELPPGLKKEVDQTVGNVSAAADGSDPAGVIKLLCDEAQLPNIQAATGQMNGRYLGEKQLSYPYAKFYSDISLSWMCDANMTPLKFLTVWHHWIFGGADLGPNQDSPKILQKNSLSLGRNLTEIKQQPDHLINRAVRLKYPEEYLAKVRITKTEKGPFAPNQRTPISYVLQDAYPYSIDAIPLSYGTSQITRVTANFYYAKHTVIFRDER